MDTQKNLMMFTIVISAIYGVWAIFAPGSIMSTYGTPEEFVNPVTSEYCYVIRCCSLGCCYSWLAHQVNCN